MDGERGPGAITLLLSYWLLVDCKGGGTVLLVNLLLNLPAAYQILVIQTVLIKLNGSQNKQEYEKVFSEE